jgi:hypothetical protein
MVSDACAGPIETTTTSVACLFQAQGFLDSDFVERIHRHLDVREFDTRPVALDANFDVVVNDALNQAPEPSSVPLRPEMIDHTRIKAAGGGT